MDDRCKAYRETPNMYRSEQMPFENTISIIEGKWKLKILYELGCEHTLRYGELKRNIPHITHKMLSAQLKELVDDGMIVREEYPQIPPKVEYSLSEKGLSFLPILIAMCKWGRNNTKVSV